MRFLLDENVHHGLVAFLTGCGHEAVRSPKGLSNGAVLAEAASQQRTLLTHDRDFAARAPTTDHPGIVLLRIPPKELGQLTSALQRLLTEQPSAALLANKLFVVFPDRHDELPFKAEFIPFE